MLMLHGSFNHSFGAPAKTIRSSLGGFCDILLPFVHECQCCVSISSQGGGR